MEGEHPGEDGRHLAHSGHQVGLAAQPEVGTGGHEGVDGGDLLVEGGEFGGGHPREHQAVDTGGDLGVVVLGAGLVGRQHRLGAEEAHVDHLGGHARGAGAHQAGDAQVQVHVAAEDLEHDLVPVVDLVEVDREAGHEVPHADVTGAMPGVVGGQWRDGVGEHLTDVAPRVDRERRRRLIVHEPAHGHDVAPLLVAREASYGSPDAGSEAAAAQASIDPRKAAKRASSMPRPFRRNASHEPHSSSTVA